MIPRLMRYLEGLEVDNTFDQCEDSYVVVKIDLHLNMDLPYKISHSSQ